MKKMRVNPSRLIEPDGHKSGYLDTCIKEREVLHPLRCAGTEDAAYWSIHFGSIGPLSRCESHEGSETEIQTYDQMPQESIAVIEKAAAGSGFPNGRSSRAG